MAVVYLTQGLFSFHAIDNTVVRDQSKFKHFTCTQSQSIFNILSELRFFFKCEDSLNLSIEWSSKTLFLKSPVNPIQQVLNIEIVCPELTITWYTYSLFNFETFSSLQYKSRYYCCCARLMLIDETFFFAPQTLGLQSICSNRWEFSPCQNALSLFKYLWIRYCAKYTVFIKLTKIILLMVGSVLILYSSQKYYKKQQYKGWPRKNVQFQIFVDSISQLYSIGS